MNREYSVVIGGSDMCPVLIMARSFRDAYNEYMEGENLTYSVINPAVVVYYSEFDGIMRRIKKKVFYPLGR